MSEKLYAVAGGTGFTDSPVATANYVIQPPPASPVATTTTLTSPTTHLINGQQAGLTATVVPASGAAPTGNVSFYAGGQLLGSAALSGGQATLATTISTQPGIFQVTATYNGSALDSKSTSVPLTFTVLATTTSALTSNATQVVEGTPLVLSAVVAAGFGGGPPTGTIVFYAGSTALGTQTLSAGKATDNAQINLPVGQYQLTAVYAGDGDDEPSTSNALNLTVTAPVVPQVSTSTVLTISTSTPTAGQSMQLSALVTAVSGSSPTGMVNFFLGQTQIGSTSLVSGAARVFINAPSSSGSYQLTAAYAGTSQDSASSSAPVTITIAPSVAATNTSLVSSAQQVIQGQSFALSATVASHGSSYVTGSVNFFLGQTQLGSTTLTTGQASWSGFASFAPGTYQLTAVYTGNSQDSGSTSNPVSLVVTAPAVPQVSTNTALTVTPAAPAPGQSMQLSALITAADGSTPTGVVNFFLGQTQLGSANLISGAAGVSINAPSASGSYQITASYAGTSQDSASSSAPVTITIAPSVAATSIDLVASTQQVLQGQSFALNATVASSGSNTATGTVNFFLGQTQVGSSALTSGQANWSGPATFSPGAYQLTATYSGDQQDSASTSSPVALVILPDVVTQQTFDTTTTLSFSPQQVATGQTVTISIQVAEQGGTTMPSGSVAVYLGSTQLGTAILTNGSASVSMQAPAPGSYTLSAAYAGDAQDLSSQSPVVAFVVNVATATVPVAPSQPGNPTFTLGLSNSSIALAQGQSASLQVSLSAVQGYQGAIQLSCAGLPAGVACNFSPATVSLQATSANSVLSLSSSTTTASNSAFVTNATFAMLAPWDVIGLLGFVSTQRRRKSRFGSIFALLALSAGLVAMTGCGLNVNSITQPYQVSVTAVGANQQSQTQTFTLNVNGPAATF